MDIPLPNISLCFLTYATRRGYEKYSGTQLLKKKNKVLADVTCQKGTVCNTNNNDINESQPLFDKSPFLIQNYINNIPMKVRA